MQDTVYAKFKAGKADHPIHALNDKAQFDGNDRYNESKLLNIFITRDISKIASSKIIVNTVNPGASSLRRWTMSHSFLQGSATLSSAENPPQS